MKTTAHDRWMAGIPPMIIVGAVVVLLPLFTLVTVLDINRQKENSVRLMLEKGAALIRSFEAGTRTGMMGMRGASFKLQRLIMETAQQPDIAYILVTGAGGLIRAASDPSRIGSRHDGEAAPVASDASDADQTLRWRIVAGGKERRVFEVYRRFLPVGIRAGLPPDGHHERMRPHWTQLLPELDGARRPQDLMIFIGLDMSGIEAARKADARHAVVMGLVLLFCGFTGMMLIYVLQGYRSARSSLSRIRAFSDLLVENMPIGLVAVDGDGTVASINHEACRILDISPDGAAGRPSAEVLPPDLRREIDRFRRNGAAVEGEIDCGLGHGRTIPLAFTLSGLGPSAAGEFGGTLVLLRDLSDVRALQQEVARNQRLASVGKLAAGVAHEVRNPLSSIKGFATYFKQKYIEVSEDQQIAAIMIQEVDRLNRVVTQLLDLARPVSLNLRPVGARAFLEGSLRLVAERAGEKGIATRLDASAGDDTIYADPDQLGQVLLNLYLNAIDAMETGGRLTVALERDPARRGVWIAVVDTGTGISREDVPHVFDPYFTTKPGGTGLGLAIAHNIVEAHRGQIAVENRAGGGTLMRLFLPDKRGEADGTS